MALNPKLLEILACPKDKGPLLYFADEESLYNPRLRLRYRITDDIPIMLVDEAETLDGPEHERLLAKAAADGITPTFDPGPSLDTEP
jgi:uncharacterized protein YbaR (Trm112 family)